jgi:hypothetical protein
MLTLNTSKYAQPTSFLIHRHQPLCILCLGSPRLHWIKDTNHELGELTHTLYGHIFVKAKVLVGIVGRDAFMFVLCGWERVAHVVNQQAAHGHPLSPDAA